ncbi:Prenylated Rab acceptor 1 [Elasticomyces elasticus]|nr:Prenylated Rab acceptor 1 [Elasticomyces elasticus]KAK3661004.1 Prenylated Rab acceptor 1 [Elasticomyces elasticus]KAK4932411.1 Prenylated Rab acceptor 1 [Elasticomyces elasticus]KAK5768419.1 Prenylated Rab acceptor 1 [Elasticomyces elasticus]
MARLNIPIEALTSRLNLGSRFDSVRSQSIANRFANLKPIGEFLDIKRISKPSNMSDLQTRVNWNLSYFSSNYAVLFVMLSIYSLLTNLLLFFVILLVIGGMFGIGKLQGADLDVGFARATTSQLYTALVIVAVPLGLWARPFATALWLVGKRFKARSAAPSSPLSTYNDMGRPPVAPNGEGGSRMRRRQIPPDDWELRQQQEYALRYGERFEEVSEDEDEVLLDANGYVLQERAFKGDELHFDGYDLGLARQDRQRRRRVYDYEDEQDFDSEEEKHYRRLSAAARKQDEDLVQSALARIAAARAKGKRNVDLTTEEMEALERRREGPLPERRTPPPTSMVTVPIPALPVTPAKTPAKGKVGSRTNSSTSLVGQTRKKGGKVPSASPAKSNSKAKVERKASMDAKSPYSFSPGGTPGIMVPGPNGVPVFAPLVNYPPPPASPELARAAVRSRSSSKHSRRDSTPPERPDPYVQYPTPYYMPQHQYQRGQVRPESSGSNRSVPEDEGGWYGPTTPLPKARNRSVSNAQYTPYRRSSNDDYDGPSPTTSPAAQGRRNVSGPPASAGQDVRYASLRRVPPGSSPLAPRPGPGQHAVSDPAVFGSGRKGSGLGRGEMGRSGSSGSEELQMEAEPVAYAGHSRTVAAGGGTEGRRRKSGRRA